MHALSRTADASILRHASLNAKVLAQKTAPSSAFTRSIDMVVLADIALPIPKPLTARLVAVGVDERPATLISSALTRVITSYKNLCEADYRRRRASLEGKLGAASTLPALYVALFSKAVKDWTTFLLEDITPRVVQIQRRQGLLRVTSSEQQRRRFNQNAVPLLERFFERNAFPSRLEKFELAATCDMDYRQIHVWFQNRRSRWRKEGRTLTRIETSDEPREVLENTVVNALLPGEPDEDSDQASCDEAMIHIEEHQPVATAPLNPDAPPHAFPSPYPPVCSYEPFPLAHRERSFVVRWPRVARESLPATAISVDDLTSRFSRLTIREDVHERAHHSTRLVGAPPRMLHSQAPVGFATPCARAPHPALVGRTRRSHRRRFSITIQDLFVTRTACGTAKELRFGLPAMDSPLNRDSPSSTPSSAASSRHHSHPISGDARRMLPRRLPKNPPRWRPHSGDCASFDRPLTTCRPKLRRVSTSSTATSSDIDSPLSTPPLRPTSLPPSDAVQDSRPIDVKAETQLDFPWFASIEHWNFDQGITALHTGSFLATTNQELLNASK